MMIATDVVLYRLNSYEKRSITWNKETEIPGKDRVKLKLFDLNWLHFIAAVLLINY
jgi:hypothetical protein